MDTHEEPDTASQPFFSSDEGNTASEHLSEGEPRDILGTKIIHSTYVIWIVLFYAALVLFSWIVICKLTYHPITTKHYGVWFGNDGGDYYKDAAALQAKYQQNERWYKAAQVIQSIASVLTIPLTSTVCSSAAVIYLQQSTGRTPSFTLRQMITLADKGWTDIGTYLQLVMGHWSRYSSAFLIWAILLHIIGAIISPLEQIFLSTETVKIPTYSNAVLYLLDIPDKFRQEEVGSVGPDATIPVAREILASTSGTDLAPQIWGGEDCATVRGNTITKVDSTLCSHGGIIWGNLSLYSDPFLAQLPRDYNTGLIQQFLPRFNSSAGFENISSAEFPSDCDTTSGALSIRQSGTPINATGLLTDAQGMMSWAVHACMPTDVRKTPWKSTRARQYFSENLYLNISLSKGLKEKIANDQGLPFSETLLSEYFRVTVNTTAGYFELPNYMNGGEAGPLLSHDPNSSCGKSCEVQGKTLEDIYNGNDDLWWKTRRGTDTMPSIEEIELVRNKGPLLTTALALFGPNSWLDLANRYPDIYTHRNVSYDNSTKFCIDLAPLSRILTSRTLNTGVGDGTFQFPGNDINSCIISSDPGEKEVSSAVIVGSWLNNFRLSVSKADNADLENNAITARADLENAFTIAAYLANMAWISGGGYSGNSLTVNYDIGVDTQKPAISLAGLIILSVLIGLDLVGLLATAIYASWHPRWTESLDAFSMLRLGSSIGGRVPLKIAFRNDHACVLDETPGWVGVDDSLEESDPRRGHVECIALGGSGRLRSGRYYDAYEGKEMRRGGFKVRPR